MQRLVQVPENDRHEHGADVAREGHADQLADKVGDHGSDGHRHQKGRDILDDVQGGKLLTAGCVDLVKVRNVIFTGIRLQIIFYDELSCQRTAQQDAGDQAEGRRRGTDLNAGRITHVREGLAVGARGSVSADHGDGAGQQGVGRFQAHSLADADADHVLEDRDHARAQPVDDQQRAALRQKREACAEAHAGEEGQHERALEIGVELESKGIRGVADKGDEHEDKAAHHRSRDAVLVQEFRLAFDKIADQQQDRCHGCGHDGCAVDIQNAFHKFKRHNIPPLILFTVAVYSSDASTA